MIWITYFPLGTVWAAAASGDPGQTLSGAIAMTAVKFLPPLMFFGAALAMGRHAQREQLRVLEKDPSSLSRSALAQALLQMRKIIHFLDLKAFYYFILITFITILLFFFNHPPGYITLILLAGLLGYNAGRGSAAPARKTMARVLTWLGQNYLRQELWDDLDFILKRLADYPAFVEKTELGWMQAQLAINHNDPQRAIAALAPLPPSPRADPLLIQLLLEAGGREAAEERLARQQPETAVSILKGIPAGPARDRALLARLLEAGDWEGITELIAPMGPPEAVAFLESIAPSPTRDDLLFPALARAEEHDKIMKLAAGYGGEEGEARLRRVLSPGPALGQAVIALHGGLGDFGQVRKYIAGAPAEMAVPAVLALPASDERDRILFELWTKIGDIKSPGEHFDPFEPERPIAILLQLPPGPTRDRLLGYYSSYAGDVQAVVDSLEKYLPSGLLTPDEGRSLANAYAKLGQYEKIENALHLTGAKDDI